MLFRCVQRLRSFLCLGCSGLEVYWLWNREVWVLTVDSEPPAILALRYLGKATASQLGCQFLLSQECPLCIGKFGLPLSL